MCRSTNTNSNSHADNNNKHFDNNLEDISEFNGLIAVIKKKTITND